MDRTTEQTLCCKMQNRLGALDRALGALTLRGLMPTHMVTRADAERDLQELFVTFHCDDEALVTMLIKALQKQVTVLDVTRLMAGEADAPAFATTPAPLTVSH